MQAGDVIADRFTIERLARTGGMGSVFRARDATTGDAVAVKLLNARGAEEATRFAGEARVLASLRHPGIVRHVAHGTTANGDLYLAMEWLDGEDLAQRLERDGVTPAEAVRLISRAAEALASAHEQGIVHRDIKPSNLFLPDGDIERVKVLDFGIARLGAATHFNTGTGNVIGTPGYMSPEQARGERVLDARADVFALGCVLFECLTGRVAFTGDHAVAVLAKILMEDAPRLAELRPDLPEALDGLLARMLAKSRDGRPIDAMAVVRELGRVGTLGAGVPRALDMPVTAITGSEQRRLFVVLVGGSFDPLDATAPTMSPVGLADSRTRFDGIATSFGARIELLANGSVIATVAGSGSATDHAARAARCALALRLVAGGAPVAVATGRGVIAERLPLGEVIDRAIGVLRAGGDHVRIDGSTAALLDARFDIAADESGLILRAEREASETVRLLLGKPTPCFGRERELRALESTFDACVSESESRAVLITAAPGVGKSRLRHEFARALADRGDAATLWLARGDPMSAGSPFGLLAQALRRAIGGTASDPVALREAIRDRVARNGCPVFAVEFLAELLGAAPDETPSTLMQAARRDAAVMGEQLRRAFEAFVGAEVAHKPVVLVLEDLHWGDVPTVRFVDGALRALEHRPFMVLALARPEVHELFPKLWDGRFVEEIRLRELNRRASERFVRHMLGVDASAALVEDLVNRSSGNAFYLEELIRAAADGKTGALPDSILAMLEGRLDELPPEARRVLRAASIFGQASWKRGVATLLGDGRDTTGVGSWLDELVDREVLERRTESRFRDETEFAFRHALWRDAAYASFTDHDRKLGHRLAGDWLERSGERDAMILAEHFDRAEASSRAIACYVSAATQALEGNDHAAVITRAERGLACGAAGIERGALRSLEAQAHAWRGELLEAEPHALEAHDLLAPGTLAWCRNAAVLMALNAQLGRIERLGMMIQSLQAVEPEAEAIAAYASSAAIAITNLCIGGLAPFAMPLHERLESFAGPIETSDPTASGWLNWARAYVALFTTGDVWRFHRLAETAARAFREVSDLRGESMAGSTMGTALLNLGDAARAVDVLRAAYELGERTGNHYFARIARLILSRALAADGKADEARSVARDAVESFARTPNSALLGWAQSNLAGILADARAWDDAEREVRAALLRLDQVPTFNSQALAVLARVLIETGKTEEGLECARKAMAPLESFVAFADRENMIRLVYAEALHAAGDRAAARIAITTASDRLLARAERIDDRAARERFFAGVAENARTMELARAWGRVE